jgi:hypothetical protein
MHLARPMCSGGGTFQMKYEPREAKARAFGWFVIGSGRHVLKRVTESECSLHRGKLALQRQCYLQKFRPQK